MIHPYRNKQLFLDDDAIHRTYGLRRVLNKPTRRVGPVLRPDRSRGQTSLQTADPPQWNSDEGVWEWFYGAGYAVPPQGRRLHAEQHATHYATSEDGVHWDTSALGLYEWMGSRDNNVAIDPGGKTLAQIVRDERDEDPLAATRPCSRSEAPPGTRPSRPTASSGRRSTSRRSRARTRRT